MSELADEKLNNKRKALGIKKTLPAYGEEAYTYGLHINKYNTTTGFVPNVRIPAWLVGEDSNITNSDTNFSGGISIFLKDFQKEYFNSEKKIVDFFKSIDGKSIAQIGIL